MSHSHSRAVTLSGLALTLALIFALSPSFAPAQTSGPVAYIYVSSNYSGSNNRVVGYAASANGQLTQISGSPWADNLSYLATSGTYLFGSTNLATDNGKNVFSYSVQSNGALKYIGATNIQDGSSNNACNQASLLTLEHTGSFLYVLAQEAYCNPEGAFQSFSINKSTGKLSYLGLTQPTGYYALPLAITADNLYAFDDNNEEADQLAGYKIAANGELVDENDGNNTFPGTEGQPSGSNGDFGYTAADPTNHLAEGYVYTDAYTGAYITTKIGTLTVNTATGTVSTTSAYDNMPSTDTPVSAMVMSPSGKLLAVGGSGGIQIFNFDPSGQATANTGLITTAPITAMYWDNDNHLYAISNADNALHVFTVMPTSATEVSGSPYSIPRPVAMTGHSLSTTGGACSAPTSNGVNVCSPAEGSTVTSPVSISAAAYISGGVYRFSLWNGNTKLLNEDSGAMNGSVSLAAGTYKLIFDAVNSSGVHADATRNITVK